jgi:Arc/MetJ-type ribon-helix-helix transcriptional regulator
MLISKYDFGMSKKGRITITLDRELIEAANAEVAAGRADSLSAWMAAAVTNHLENERRLAALDDAIAWYEAQYGAFTPEELAEQERRDRRNAIVIRGSGKRRARKRRSRAA